MAWRPAMHLLEGELNNTTPGKVTGWMRFAGMKDKVTFDLKGDFHRDIRGARIRLRGFGRVENVGAASYMEGFARHQTGNVGDMTAGLPPIDYVDYPYIEWYGHENGRIVIELKPSQVEVIGKPLPWMEQEPLSRQQQVHNMDGFLGDLVRELNLPPDRVICLRGNGRVSHATTHNTEGYETDHPRNSP